jgi:hypothetical protein
MGHHPERLRFGDARQVRRGDCTLCPYSSVSG